MKLRVAIVFALCLMPALAMAQDPHLGEDVAKIAGEIAGLSSKIDLLIGYLKGVQYLQWTLIAEGCVISIHQMIPVWRHRQ